MALTKYDKRALGWIVGLTLFVALLIVIAPSIGVSVSMNWLVMPMAWFIGAMMAWAHSKKYYVN